RWPSATWAREVPVTAIVDRPDGGHRIEGVIDLLLTVPAGLIIIDHKTYPAPSIAAVTTRAAEYLPQVASYAEALGQCGHHVVGVCIHFPVAAMWLDLRSQLMASTQARADACLSSK